MGTFSISIGDYFGSIVSFYPEEPLMQKIVDNREQMKDMATKLLSNCDDISDCVEFSIWHDARLEWLKHRNLSIPEFRGYDERHKVVQVNGLTCSRIEYSEKQKVKVIDGKSHYYFRRWNFPPVYEYISDTACPIIFDGKIVMLRIDFVQAEVTYASKEQRKKNINRYENIIQPSINSIKFLGEVSK